MSDFARASGGLNEQAQMEGLRDIAIAVVVIGIVIFAILKIATRKDKSTVQRCNTIEAEVRRKYEAQLAATNDYWKQVEIEDMIKQEVKQRLKNPQTPQESRAAK